MTHVAQLDDTTAHACVRAALEAGITTFDTADVYSDTLAEIVLGQALKEVHELCTEVFHPTGSGPNDGGLSRKHIMGACHASLNRLQTDYIDVYYAHRYDATVSLEETFLAFADLVR